MNLTKEMEYIKQISDELSNKNVMVEQECRLFDEQEGSFWQKRVQNIDVEEYGFHNVVEMRELLNMHWNKCGISDLEKFLTLICISTFKNKSLYKNTGEVSKYIYEF